MTKEKGILYVMTTVVGGIVKIGRTGSDNFKNRMSALERDGYFNVTGLKRTFAIEVEDYKSKEELLKKILQRSRLGESELYSLDIKLVIQLLSSFEGDKIYPIEETKEEIFEQAADAFNSSELPDGEYSLDKNVINSPGKKENVKGILKVEKGQLTLLRNSVLSSKNNIKSKGYASARFNAQTNGRVLVEDLQCDSVSMAASIVCGTNQNGWKNWKDKDGNCIDKYRKNIDSDDDD